MGRQRRRRRNLVGRGRSRAAAKEEEERQRQRQLQLGQTSTLVGLSIKPRDVVDEDVQCTINADNTVPSICYVIQAKLTLFSDTILDATSIFQINNIIEQTITNGDLISVDNRLLDIPWNSFNDNSPITSSSGTGGGE